MSSSTPSINTTRKDYIPWLMMMGFIYLFTVSIFGIFAFIPAFLIQTRDDEAKDKHRVFYIAGVIAGLAIFVLFVQINFIGIPANIVDLVKQWLILLPTFPLYSAVLELVDMFRRFSKPKTLQEQLEESEQRLHKANEKARNNAEQNEVATNRLVLGAKAGSSDIQKADKIYLEKNQVTFDEALLDEHIFILGSTGTGKTETIKRIIYETLQKTNRDIIFVDGKGDYKLANEIRAIAHKFGRGEVPIFTFGEKTGAIYNGFIGSKLALFNRIVQLIGLDNLEGNAQYYGDINRKLLAYVVGVPVDEITPPKNIEELTDRLDEDWLLDTYANYPRLLKRLANVSKKDIAGLVDRLLPIELTLAEVMGEEGFAIEDNGAIFSIKTTSYKDTAQGFLNFLVEDLKDFAGQRQQRPALLVIDEFGAFNNENIDALLTMARSFNLGVILATQDMATLKDEKIADIVLYVPRTKIIMGTDNPEKLAELGGTKYQVELGLQYDEGDPTGVGTARVQHSFKVDPNTVRGLKAGQLYIVRQAKRSFVKVQQIEEVPQIAEQAQEKRAVYIKEEPIRREPVNTNTDEEVAEPFQIRKVKESKKRRKKGV